jgi:glycosyltransferase involved in cell wall biosynthesis
LEIEAQNPVIEVLLATYNGSKYLSEFLESLARQQGVSIILRVSDDRSSDETLDIVNQYAGRFLKLIVVEGPGNGPSDNFFSLIKEANSDFIALADQDDVWEPTHLINSIGRLRRSKDTPAMTFSSVSEFEGDVEDRQRIWPLGVKIDRPMIFFLENLARGCTIVFNKSALKCINRHQPANAVMHDWWISLLISLIGEVSFSDYPEVNYRLHDSNFIGSKPNSLSRLRRFAESRKVGWPPIDQLREIYLYYGQQISPRKLKKVELIVNGLTSLSFTKKIRAVLTGHRIRNSALEDFCIRILLMTRTNASDSFSWFIYRRVRMAVRQIITLFKYSIPDSIDDFKSIRIHRKHLDMKVAKKSETLSHPRKIALIALYPRGPLIKSVERLISQLIARDYEVITIVNSSTQRDWLPTLSGYPISIIVRANIGRDFGAYQAGIRYCVEFGLLEDIEVLLLCNDSVFYGQRTSDFIDKFESTSKSNSWTTAFLNFEKHTHAQSFFQSFSGEIVRSDTFQNFWMRYFPSKQRTHAIDKGEVKLSQNLISSGYFPVSVVTAENIALAEPKRELLFEDFYSVLLEQYYNLISLPKEIQIDFFWHQLQRSFMEKNCSHAIGLLAFKTLGAPLKLDLHATGRVTLESLGDALRGDGLQEEEVLALLHEFQKIRAQLS